MLDRALHRRRAAGRLARAVAALRARAVAGDDPQRDGGPGGDGLHREPAHVRGPRADAQGLSLLRRQPDGGEAARAAWRSTGSKAASPPIARSSSSTRPRRLLSQLTHFAGVVMTPRRREPPFRHLEFLRLSEPPRAPDRRDVATATCRTASCTPTMPTRTRSSSRRPITSTSTSPASRSRDPRAVRRDELHALRDDIARPDVRRRSTSGEGALQQARRCVVTGERNLLDGARSRVEHGAPAPAVRPVRAEDFAAASARHLAEGAGRVRSTSAASPGWRRSTR